MRRSALALVVATTATGCGDGALRAVEPARAELRIAVVFTDPPRVQTLVGDAPLRVELGADFDAGRSVDVWLLGYSLATLRAALPGLEALDAATIATRLDANLEGRGVPAPEPDGLHTARLDPDGEAPSYRSERWTSWESTARASLQAGLRVVPPTPSGPGCEAIEIERLTGAVDLPLARVTVPDDDHAHFAGPTDSTVADDPMIRGRADGLVVTVFPLRDELRGRPNELAHDPDGRIHSVSGRFRAPRGPLEVWDADGASLPSPDLLGRPIGAITIDTAGWRYPYGREGLLAIAPGSERAELRAEHPWPVIWAFAVRPDLIGSYDGFALRVFDGAVWREERTMEAFESVSRIGGDADALIAVGPREQVFWRETRTARWETLPLAFDQGVNFRGVAAVGGGRFVAAGTQGRIGVWMGGRWCTVETGGITDLHGAAASPSGRTVYVVGEDPDPARDGDPVWAFRLRMPAL